MGLENYFNLSNTKIHIRTDTGDKRFISLLSNVALLHDVQIYPTFTGYMITLSQDFFR